MVIFIDWVVFIPSEQKKPHLHKKLRKNKDLCGAVMSSEETKILEFNQYYKFYKTPSINYAELDF